MTGENNIQIRKANIYDWDKAIELAWRTFLKFEAKDYGDEGVKSFRDFLSDSMLRKMFVRGAYPMFIALEGEVQTGMISLRDKTHISLLFVEEGHHHRGIGRNLIKAAEEFIKKEYREYRITVNAAPYAIGFYHEIGFEDVAPQLSNEGIIYTPMEKSII